MGVELTPEDAIHFFWDKVNKTPTCWLWTKSVYKSGYGGLGECALSRRYKTTLTHRLSWILHNGPIPKGLLVLHTCDNPPCVNPNHLFLGTDMDNTKDKMSKKRHVFGAVHWAALLTEPYVLQIRQLYSEGTYTKKELSQAFGVSRPTINDIVSRRTWKHC